MKKPMNLTLSILPVALFSLIAASAALAAGVDEPSNEASGAVTAASSEAATPVSARCRDVRVRANERATFGTELVTVRGNQAVVQFLPDRSGQPGNSAITYQRITRRDAQDMGFAPATGFAVFMLQGDEGIPAEYVVLPLNMAALPSRIFDGAYGTLNESGAFEPELATRMACQVL